MDNSSGIGVLDKSVAVLSAVALGPVGLVGLVSRTGLNRATAHRLAVALTVHGLLERDPAGRFVLGARLSSLAAAAPDPLVAAAGPVLDALRASTGESVQLYRRQGSSRVCVATAEPPSGLRNTVPVGSVLPLTAGSAAQVLLAFAPGAVTGHDAEPPARTGPPRPDAQPAKARAFAADGDLVQAAVFDAPRLARVRRDGLAASVEEREPGLASVSAPVLSAGGVAVAALSLSGPVERLSRQPARRHGAAVRAAADQLAAALLP